MFALAANRRVERGLRTKPAATHGSVELDNCSPLALAVATGSPVGAPPVPRRAIPLRSRDAAWHGPGFQVACWRWAHWGWHELLLS